MPHAPPPSLQVGADGKEILLQPPSGDELPARGFDPGMETYQVGWQPGRMPAAASVLWHMLQPHHAAEMPLLPSSGGALNALLPIPLSHPPIAAAGPRRRQD